MTEEQKQKAKRGRPRIGEEPGKKPSRSQQLWKEQNKERIRAWQTEYQRKYREANRDRINEIARDYSARKKASKKNEQQ